MGLSAVFGGSLVGVGLWWVFGGSWVGLAAQPGSNDDRGHNLSEAADPLNSRLDRAVRDRAWNSALSHDPV